MNEGRAYLDYNATAPLRPEARAAVLHAISVFGNPSSVHAEGRQARNIIETAREEVAALVGAKPAEVVFTSGATEANAWALSLSDATIVACGIEHPSVLAAGSRVVTFPTDTLGRADLAAAEDRLAAIGDVRKILALQVANNETGVLQPMVAAAELARCLGAGFHTDAVQAVGRIVVSFDDTGADTLALSSHKIGGPKGAGALVVRDDFELVPWLRGGGQERRRRAGTENVLAIAGFGAAATAARDQIEEAARLADLRDELEREIRSITPDVHFAGEGSDRLPNTTCVALPGRSAETLVIRLDLAGIAVSSGAACSSGKVSASTVLRAMGWDDALAGGAIRLSLGHDSTERDIRRFLIAWRDIAATSKPKQQGDERMRLAS